MCPLMTRQQKHPRSFNTVTVVCCYVRLWWDSLKCQNKYRKYNNACITWIESHIEASRYISFAYFLLTALMVSCQFNISDAEKRSDYFLLLNASASGLISDIHFSRCSKCGRPVTSFSHTARGLRTSHAFLASHLVQTDLTASTGTHGYWCT